ncbi:universal stress protein [Reinekea sp.]|jgi:nucleotide-binding universal stress UspA family protein|uniref:universal stress protein n=1 Tax=Reinekea sp. TaxID=1970455 RepID=UPI002A816B28|nr:universal stress protein [Reinekea sp.]
MYRIIVAPIDLAVPTICEHILHKALFHLRNSDCQVHLTTIASANADEAKLDELRGKLMVFAEEHISAHEGRIHLNVAKGLPADQILAFADGKNAELILVGSHRGGASQLGRATLGSTAAKVASQAKCDVCIVKAD